MAKWMGQFTLMGKTVPLTFDVTLVGAGPGFAGGPTMGHVIGIHAEGAINPQDFGLPVFFKEPIQIGDRHGVRQQILKHGLRELRMARDVAG